LHLNQSTKWILNNSKTGIHLQMLHDPHLVCSDASRIKYCSSDSGPSSCTTCIDPCPHVGQSSCSQLFLYLLSWGKFFPLLVVLSHVDAINTTIVALDPFFLLDTHSYKLFECPFVIHGVVVHLKGFEFFRV
jgi:hypothetical protein